jgi:Fe-S-cluster containining protein
MSDAERKAAAGLIIRNHRMGHIPELRVGAELVGKRFVPGCSMTNCNADCCSGGVYADLTERDAILEHADLVRAQMDPGQARDTDLWFEKETIPDADYPSGRAIGTEVYDDRCVFLNSKGMCVLQKAAAAAGMDRYALKPFFCWLYPVTVDNGELTLHDPDYAERPECCSYRDSGPLTVLDVCPEELGLALGGEGVDELRKMMDPAVPGRGQEKEAGVSA